MTVSVYPLLSTERLTKTLIKHADLKGERNLKMYCALK